MNIQNEIIKILGKYTTKIQLHDEGALDPMDFHKVAPEIKKLLELESISLNKSAKDLLKQNHLLIEDDLTCEAHTHLVVRCMEIYAKKKAIDFVMYIMEREPGEDEAFYGPKKLGSLYDSFNTKWTNG